MSQMQRLVKIEVTIRRLRAFRDWVFEGAGEESPYTQEIDEIIALLEETG